MPKKTRHYNIFIGGDDIHYVNIFNYLSIKLDEKLDFESHAKECLRPVSHKLYLVSRIRYPALDLSTVERCQCLPHCLALDTVCLICLNCFWNLLCIQDIKMDMRERGFSELSKYVYHMSLCLVNVG